MLSCDTKFSNHIFWEMRCNNGKLELIFSCLRLEKIKRKCAEKFHSNFNTYIANVFTLNQYLIYNILAYFRLCGEIMLHHVYKSILLGSKIIADGDCSHEIKRCLLCGRGAMTYLYSILKSRDYFVNKGASKQSYGFSNSHIWMWELGYKESWVLKNWCFWTVVLEKILESPLDCKEFKLVKPK